MAAIGLGVFSLILVTSVMNGLGGSVVDRMLEVEPQLIAPLKKGEDWDLAQQKLERDLESVLPRGCL